MSFSQQISHDKSFHLAPKSKICKFATSQCYAERLRIRTMTFSSHLQVLGNPLLGSASLDLGEVSNQLLDRMLLITELIDQGVVVADDAHEDTRLPDVVLDVPLGHGSQLHLFQSLLILAAAGLGEDHVPSLPDY